MPARNKKDTLSSDNQKKSNKGSKGKTTRELTDLHLKDKNHVITEEDIKDLDIDLNNPDTGTAHTPDISDDKQRPKDEDKDPSVITPWDLISE